MSAFGAPKHEGVISPVRHVRPLTVRATTWQNYNMRKALSLLRVRRRMLAKLAKPRTTMSGPTSTWNCLGLCSLAFYSLGLSSQRDSTARDYDEAGLDAVIG